MSHFSHEKQPSTESHQTGARFDLSDPLAKSKDLVEWHPAGNIRFIIYPTPSREHLTIQRKLIGDGLILGRKLNTGRSAEQVFVIPSSARPIAYDAPQNETGQFSYGDTQLFYDLGRLLSQASYTVMNSRIITGDIGRLVAFKEFSKKGEPKLFLVPGIESHFSDATTLLNMEQAEYYAENLSDNYGDRFNKNRAHFMSGFTQQDYRNLGSSEPA